MLTRLIRCGLTFIMGVTAFSPSGCVSYKTVAHPAPPCRELSSQDVFGEPGWNSGNLCVLGLRIGMTRTEAVTAAERSGMRLSSTLHESPQRCEWCDVMQADFHQGVLVRFGDSDRISEILIDLYVVDAARDKSRHWVSQRLVGKIGQLARNYSDRLRLELLGKEDHKYEEGPATGLKAPNWKQTFTYSKLGLRLNVEERRDKQGRRTPLEISLLLIRVKA